jgi:exopolyphosphatase/guanosine-5'-triphosphate,3'-diphosphate pyrophosphatase
VSAPLAALDLGSGTIKLSVFERAAAGWKPLCLEEANTELRRGMGSERTLKAEPLAETLKACEAFLRTARGLGVERLPAYATSAVRKSANPEALLAPLKALGVETRVLGEEEEGRWNLLGAQARIPEAKVLVIDPGGDSTEVTADLSGTGWEQAAVASLPFGSVSLQEQFGSEHDNEPIPWPRLQQALAAAKAAALSHPHFKGFAGSGLMPAIRMNAPIQRALQEVNGRARTAHGEGDLFSRAELEQLNRRLASLDHGGRGKLLDGEPIGKVDRTCYGFASWLGILDALGAEAFVVEPWGIKLGAVIALNRR